MIQDERWRICSCLGEVLEQRRRWLYVICNIISGWWNFSVFLKSMFQFIKVLALIVVSKPISLIWSTASWQQSFFQRVLFTPNSYQEHTFVPNLKHLVRTQLLVAVLKNCLISTWFLNCSFQQCYSFSQLIVHVLSLIESEEFCRLRWIPIDWFIAECDTTSYHSVRCHCNRGRITTTLIFTIPPLCCHQCYFRCGHRCSSCLRFHHDQCDDSQDIEQLIVTKLRVAGSLSVLLLIA